MEDPPLIAGSWRSLADFPSDGPMQTCGMWSPEHMIEAKGVSVVPSAIFSPTRRKAPLPLSRSESGLGNCRSYF